jgi:hypothetical protein
MPCWVRATRDSVTVALPREDTTAPPPASHFVWCLDKLSLTRCPLCLAFLDYLQPYSLLKLSLQHGAALGMLLALFYWRSLDTQDMAQGR